MIVNDRLKILHSLKGNIYPRHRASWWICSPLLGSLPHTHTLLHGAQWRSLWWTSVTPFHTPASCGSRLDVWLCHPGTSRCLVSEGLPPGLRGGRCYSHLTLPEWGIRWPCRNTNLSEGFTLKSILQKRPSSTVRSGGICKKRGA